MKFLIAILTVGFATSTFGQVDKPIWSIEEVYKDNTIVGYISQTSAIGTAYTNPLHKSITNLRLICTVEDKSPLIAIVWEGSDSVGPQSVTIEVDGIPIGYEPIRWDQAGKFIFRNLNDSNELIQSFQTGDSVKFSWNDTNDGLRRATMFSLANFNQNLNQFKSLCKI